MEKSMYMNHEPCRTYSKDVEGIKNDMHHCYTYKQIVEYPFVFPVLENGVKHFVIDAMLPYCH